MTTAMPHMVCGCLSTHREGCVLGAAEEVAALAIAATPTEHPLIAALSGLHFAGMLGEVGPDPDEVDAVLDLLCQLGQLRRPDGAS